ncbi:winged helix-turn-helix domain-containing protein [Candidatus Woesearchaeota archaeon]|nr:winged helix-turn-helix domain-containing protein [Candidatus Woesearchaeota archaeon]
MIRFYEHRITIIRSRKPQKRNLNEELQWFGSSLGLFNMRDKDKSCYRIFVELLKAAKARVPLSSDEIALRSGLTRGTVIHHLNKLIEAGIAVHHRNRYLLRVDNLRDLINELERDVKRACEDLKEIAEEIDNSIGL